MTDFLFHIMKTIKRLWKKKARDVSYVPPVSPFPSCIASVIREGNLGTDAASRSRDGYLSSCERVVLSIPFHFLAGQHDQSSFGNRGDLTARQPLLERKCYTAAVRLTVLR